MPFKILKDAGVVPPEIELMKQRAAPAGLARVGRMTPAARPPVRDSRGVWRFSRHADVAQALRDPRLVPPGQGGLAPAAHRAFRAAADAALSPARLTAWRAVFAAQAQARADALHDGSTVDLVASLAEPWSQAVALQVTGLGAGDAAVCLPLAQQLFTAAAQVTDGETPEAALSAATALARLFAALPQPHAGYADVQAFVALSQSLPALLAGAWLALLRHPEAQATWRAAPTAIAGGAGELLRLGGPAQAVFREAAQDCVVGGVALPRGARIALLVGAANRDAERYADPECLDLARATSGQLALGTGEHHCAGAALVRLALVVATEVLLARSASLTLVDEAPSAVVWRGGFAMRAPAALPVVWRSRR